MPKQPDWTIIYFKNFWALVERRQVPTEADESEPDRALLGFLDFWAMATMEEDEGDVQEQDVDDIESMPESSSEADDSSEDEFFSLGHFAKMWVLEAEQRYLLRTLEIQAQILDDQDRRLKEHKKVIKAKTLERERLAKARRKMETVRNHKILGSFAQFWTNIEQPETRNEGFDYLEGAGDFFRLFPYNM